MILHLVSHRLRRGLLSLLGAGLALGLSLGLALTSFATARDTASAYGRVLEASDAETATVAHDLPPAEAAAILDAHPAIARHRYQAGYLAFIEEFDPALTGGVLGSVEDEFGLELPTVRAGRLPDADRADEVFVNAVFADRAGVEVGDDLTLRVLSVETDEHRDVPVTVVGIGTFPRELVADETVLTGIVVPTRAFHAENEDLRLYSNSRIWLDDPGDLPALARELSEEGFFVSEIRAQERRGVEDALGPTITVLVALGLLASVATVVLVVQVAQRQQDRWRADDVVLSALGATRRVRAVVHLVSAATETVLAATVALGVMLAASPSAPIGPLHDADPAQGVHLDLTVWLVGTALLALTLTLVTTTFIYARPRPPGAVERSSPITASAQRPTSLAGLSLALRSRRRAAFRLAFATTASAALLAGVATTVVSGRAVVDEPQRYGVDFDVLAFNAFGDQTADGIEAVFGGDEVEAAASFTNRPLLIDGRTVPGLGIDAWRGEIGPTMLDGVMARHGDEVVLGIDTARRLGVEIGDEVEVQAGSSFAGVRAPAARPLRVVGLATFAAISQQGADEARLGVGALVTRPTFEAVIGSEEDLPEWTVARLAEGESASDLIEANPEGVEDALGIPTRWFTTARPAELVQLDEASPVLAGAIAVSFLLLIVVLAQGTWSGTRASGPELSVLRALGFLRSQLGRTAAWHAVPPGVAALVVGVPVGMAVGRVAFGAFARSIAVVDAPSSPAALVAALVLAVLASAGVGALVAGWVARDASSAVARRNAAGRTAGRRVITADA